MIMGKVKRVRSRKKKPMKDAGFVLVPKEPTDKMLWAGSEVEQDFGDCVHYFGLIGARDCYSAMLRAAPQMPKRNRGE